MSHVDLFEGIVTVELACCFGVLISKKLFTLHDLNKHIKNFQYKCGDKNWYVAKQLVATRMKIGVCLDYYRL